MSKLSILGIRGVPASHGGFETFAARLAPYLKMRGWEVTVYCQVDGHGPVTEDDWEGVRRVHIPVVGDGPKSTMRFDWKCISHLLKDAKPDVVLTLGYNTAAFCFRLRLNSITNLINMDGLEWRRDKWGFAEKTWLWLNERAGCVFGNHLIADHPHIGRHLATRVSEEKITMIPYGADEVVEPGFHQIQTLGLENQKYFLLVARPEPENSVLEIVRAFSAKQRGMPLVVLGNYSEDVPFQAEVLRSASKEVRFMGAVYDQVLLSSLRFYCRAYVHGHRVGGTNPSLVESLGAGSPVIAHDNGFNRWVAGPHALYFSDEHGCQAAFDSLVAAGSEVLRAMSGESLSRYRGEFTWPAVLKAYESLLSHWARSRLCRAN